MYLPIPPQPDCVAGWREAVRLVDLATGHQAQNVVISVAEPTARATLADPVVAEVDAFLSGHGKKPIETVANTIFPAALYRRYGAPQFFDRFRDNVLPKVRRSGAWSGYYFERMMELPLKLIGKGDDRRLGMTALYRNHYYIEKLLGNLIGLGRLLEFIAKEGGVALGPLTIVSTNATVDTANWNRGDLKQLFERCDQASAHLRAAA